MVRRPRLTAVDFQQHVNWLLTRWPDSRTWRQPLEDLYPDFAHVPSDAIGDALQDWFDEGHDRAPAPSLLKARALKLARVWRDDPARCAHRTFGVEDLGNGWREATCANPACRHVWQARSEQLPTVGERGGAR